MDRETLRDRFAQTYAPPNERDPIEVRDEYERYVQHVARNPNAGSYAVASAIEAPRGRVRPWMEDGAMPDVVRGTSDAETLGWFQTDGETHNLLTGVVAAVFAGGSIDMHGHRPSFSTADAGLIEPALVQLGAGVKHLERAEPGRGAELLPKRKAPVLGRLLVARGAPCGDDPDRYVVPEYLFDDPAAASTFVEWYIAIRGVRPEGRNHVQIVEQNRSDTYHDDLHALFDQVLSGPVNRHKRGVLIMPDAVEKNPAVSQYFE